MKTRYLDQPGGPHTATAWNEEASGVGILALHGFTGSGLDWAPIAPRLSHRVLAPNLLGHGTSPAPAQAEAYRIEAVVEHCMRWCETDQQWLVMGYSMGGRVALRLAHRLGDRLQGLVLIGTSPGIEDAGERGARVVQDNALAERIEALGIDWFCTHWAQQPVIRSQQRIPAALRTAMQDRRRQNRETGLAGSLRGMGQGRVAPIWGELDQIRCPALLVTGAQDQKYTAQARRMARLLPRARHVEIEQVGHCAHLEAIEPVSSVIREWLSSLPDLHHSEG